MYKRQEQGFVLKEIALFNCFCDAGELLIHDSASADIGVAHLAVSHLSIRQAYVEAGSADLGHGIFRKKTIQDVYKRQMYRCP